MYHKVVLRLELWQGKVSSCYYLVDPKDSRYWDLKRTMMPTHDFMECFIRDTPNTTCIYANLPGCMQFIGEVLFNADDVQSQIEPPSEGSLFQADETISIDDAIRDMDKALSQQGQESERFVSDGGSSEYYKLRIKVDANKVTKLSLDVSEVELETGDVIRALVGNDFNLGNVVKALRRIYECEAGRGKKGVDIAYDLKKIKYFLDDWDAARKRESK